MRKHNNLIKIFIALALILCMLTLSACNNVSDDEPSGSTATSSDSATSSFAETTKPKDEVTSSQTTAGNSEPEEPVKIPGAKFTQTGVVSSSKFSGYQNFSKISTPEYLVPGLAEKVIPQGMDVWEEKELLFISGYFTSADDSPCSMLFALDLKTGNYVGEYYIRNISGSYHTSHVGGVAVTEKNLFLANSGYLYRIPLSDIEKVGQRGDVTICEAIKTPTKASFCNYSDGILWVGDYYYPNNSSYSTPSWRHLTNRAGQEYGAWCVGYRISDSTDSGFTAAQWTSDMTYATPDVVLSIEQTIQGFAMCDDYIALSRSYGRSSSSYIRVYENPLETSPHDYVELNGTSVPLWFLDTKLDLDTYVAPPMSEGLAMYKGSLLVLFESGASYYKDDGGTDPTDMVWKMNIVK